MLNAGSLDHIITIEQKSSSQDGIGEETVTYSTFADVYAQKRYRTGKEFFQAGRIVQEDIVYFTIRHLDGLDTTMRIVEGSDIYDLLFIKYSDQRRQSIELECKKVFALPTE